MAGEKSEWKARTLEFLGRAQTERTGLLGAGLVLLTALLITAPLYDLLGLPARLIQGIVSRNVSADCLPGADGAGLWACENKLALYSMVGALVVALIMFGLRRSIRKGLLKATAPLPRPAAFLPAPVVAAMVFTMGWAGSEFHFFSRDGIVRDGFFPVVVGLLTYVTIRYGPDVQRVGAPLLQARDKVAKKWRFLLLFAVPLVFNMVAGSMRNPVRDQWTVIIGILAGWLLLVPARGDAARGVGAAVTSPIRVRKATAVTSLVLLAALLVPGAVAFGHCQAEGWFTEDRAACEAAHHAGTYSVMNGYVGIIAWLVALSVTPTASSTTYMQPPPKPGTGAAQARLLDPDAPHGRDEDGWPLAPDGRRAPADWEGEPMTVSDGESYAGDDGGPVPAGLVWYIDPNNNGRWLPWDEAKTISDEEREAAMQARIHRQEAHVRTMEGYEERKQEWAGTVRDRDRRASEEGRSRWDRIAAIAQRLRRRDRAEALLQQGEAEQEAAAAHEARGGVLGEAVEGIGRDADTLVSYETARQLGIATREGLDAVAEFLGDEENQQVAWETTRDTFADAMRLWAGDPEVRERTARNIGEGVKVGAKVGAHMAMHPIDTGRAFLGVDNWERAMDPDVPVRERVARALYGAVDATMNFGGAAVKIGDKVGDAVGALRASARSNAGITVASHIDDVGEARTILRESADALYEQKPGAVWSSAVAGKDDPIQAGRAALAAQAADDGTDARRALDAAEESGDALQIARARERLEAAEDVQRTSDRVLDSFKGGKADEAAEAVDAAQDARHLDDHKGISDEDIVTRQAAQEAEQAAGKQAFEEFKQADAALKDAIARGDAADIQKAQDALHRATMEAQRNKTALAALKNSDDATKTAFNQSLRGNVYDNVDKDVVAWAERRFGTGKTQYIGEAEPGMKVFVNKQTGERIMIFEPTNPKAGVSVGADRDFVVRVGKMEDGKLVVRDVPSHETRAIYERSIYTHSRASQYWPTESADEVMRRMDQMVTDARHREAYGTSPADFRRIITDPSARVRDPGQLSGVVADKSNHWYHEALRRPENYEEMMSEGMRQTTKQWDNQITARVQSLRAQGVDVRVPDDLQQAINAMKKGPKGTSNVLVERELASIAAPGGRPYTPQLASERAAQFWEELETLRPPPSGKPPSVMQASQVVAAGRATHGAAQGLGGQP